MKIVIFQKWQLGTVFIPDSMGYLIGTNFFGIVACRVGQWRVSIIALLIVGIACFVVHNIMFVDKKNYIDISLIINIFVKPNFRFLM